MSRYIDTDALIEKMEEDEPMVWTDEEWEWGHRRQWESDMSTIEAMPSIDIVRCEECKHWNADDVYCGTVIKGHTCADDFCSYGERSEE